MYRIAILYDGEYYERYINTVKFEEFKGNIDVAGIGVSTCYADTLDGFPMKRIMDILMEEWDYLVVAFADQYFGEWKKRFVNLGLGIPEDKILPISIFGIPAFDFNEYIELKEKRVSIISGHCWGGCVYHSLKMQFLSPFINMFVSTGDYLKMLERLPYYMSREVEYFGEGGGGNTL